MIDGGQGYAAPDQGAHPSAGEGRIHAPAQITAQAPRRVRVRQRVCLECGVSWASPAPKAEFCSTNCRSAFNNRRRVRGAELYDMFMALRYDRQAAAGLKLWRLMCRLVAYFRDEDQARRAGRRSWRRTADVLDGKRYLYADVIHKKTWAKVGR